MRLSEYNAVSSVCFTGHRDLNAEEEALITKRLTSLLSFLTKCYAGGAIGLDTVAAKTVLSLKAIYPQLELHLILPCYGQEKTWNEVQKTTYEDIRARANSVRVLAPFYYNGCMQARNKALLESADLCIAYLRPTTSSGGSLNTVLQAAKLGIPVINLADTESEDI